MKKIRINAKYKKSEYLTGVERVAYAYDNYLANNYHVEYLDYFFEGKILKNVNEQLLPIFYHGNHNEVWLHLTNTAPIIKSRAYEILLLHDTAFLDHPEWFSKGFIKWYSYLIPKLVKSKNLILTISDFSKKSIVKSYDIDEDKVKVIYNGIFRTYENSLFENIAGYDDYFFCIGGNSTRKNMRSLVEAHQLLPLDIREKCPLVIVGVSNSKNMSNDKLSVDQYIKNFGYVSENQLHSLFHNAICTVSPSFYEGFGLTVIESLSHGITPVISDIPSHNEILGDDYEFKFDPTSVSDLKKTLLNVYEHKNILKCSKTKKSYFKLSKNYLWDNQLKKLNKIIDNL